MTRKKQTPGRNWTGSIVPITNRPGYELRRIVEALNSNFAPEQILGPVDALRRERRIKETPLLLRKLVQAWQLSGPNLYKFSLVNRQAWADVLRQFETGTKLNPIRLVGAPGGGAGLYMNNIPQPEPYDEALRLFIELLLNPECSRLAGPCDRCGSYYVRRSAKNKRYCSRSCGTRATAIASMKRRRKQEREDKLKRAALAAHEWTTARTKLGWKVWVQHRIPTVSTKFLTRAVNSGELKEPIRRQT